MELPGGSPTASNCRLIFYCIVGTVSIAVAAALPDVIAVIVMTAVAGYLLSLDLGSAVHSLRERRVQDSNDPETRPSLTKTLSKEMRKQSLMFYGVFLFGVFALSLTIHLPHIHLYGPRSLFPNGTFEEPIEMPPLFQPSLTNIIWFCLVVLCLIMLAMRAIQRPFVFVLLRNPFFEKVKNGRSKLFLHTAHLMHCGGPFLSLLFIHTLVGAKLFNIPFDTFQDSFLLALSLQFIFRQIWQFPEHSWIVLSVFFAVEKLGGETLCNSVWGEVNIPLKLHFFTVVTFWLRETVNGIKTMLMFSVTSISERKQRKLLNYFLVGLNFGLTPFLVSLSLFASIFSFPLFPLFTLPLFLIGFPRPRRFWSYPVGYSANHCPDSVYYEQLAPYVAKGLHQRVLSGSLGIVYPGDFFLLRWEDRLMWVQVLEKGFMHFCYSLKGLELQETSCHTTEASRVDSIFSRAFENISEGGCFNPFFFHCMAPLSAFSAVGYSDTRNVLTGVLDSPDTLKVIKDYFLKSFLYFLLENAITRVEDPQSAVSRPASRPPSAVSRLGSADARTRKAFSTLPKAERTHNSRVSIFSGGEDSPSTKSQSGRGSRMAWVSENKVTTAGAKREVKGTGLAVPHERIREEKVVVRPVSWDSNDDPLETKSTINEREFSSQFSGGKNDKSNNAMSQSVHSSKAKSYVTSIGSVSDLKLLDSTAIGLDESLTGSESDTESTKEFFTKSVPQRPQLKGSESDSINLSEKHIRPNRRLAGRTSKRVYKNPLSVSLSPHFSWLMDVPYDEESLEDLQDSFPLSWFKFLLKRFGMMKMDKSPSGKTNGITSQDEKVLDQLLSDDLLEESYRTLLAISHIVFFGSDIGYPTPNQVFKIFSGELPNGRGTEWLKTKRILLEIILKSYRISVKLALDHTLVVPINNCWKDLEAALEEYSCDWFVGPDKEETPRSPSIIGDETWNQAVRREMPSLFSLGFNHIKSTYTSHMLTLGEADIYVGGLDEETVRAIWASLTVELLYLTNDNDERYSIQAHPILLRNLTIQAADPPLGYPIYSSPPISLGFTF